MDKIIEKINKLSLPVVILIASVILGGFFYASQVNKQRSIERQQEIKIEQENKEYVAKRKGDCYEIYEKERNKWNNVERNFYNEEKDVCEVSYENSKYNEAICEEELKKYENAKIDMSGLITECNKYFTNEF